MANGMVSGSENQWSGFVLSRTITFGCPREPTSELAESPLSFFLFVIPRSQPRVWDCSGKGAPVSVNFRYHHRADRQSHIGYWIASQNGGISLGQAKPIGSTRRLTAFTGIDLIIRVFYHTRCRVSGFGHFTLVDIDPT